MTTKTLAILLCSAASVVAAVAACDKSEGGSVLPTRPNPAITRLEIRGPGTVAPGGSARWTVVAHLSNATVRDVTAEAHWTSSNRNVVSVASGGLVTGHALGEATVHANVSPMSAAMEVIVVPPGTCRVTGLVTESDDSSPVRNARVSAISGGVAGPSTTTGDDGRYRLYGVSGDVDFRVTKDGYEPLIQRQTIVDHVVMNARLTLLRQRPDVSGTYTLTIAASDECGLDTVPAELRMRKYTAVVAQRGNRLEIQLEGAAFAVSASGKGSGFAGWIEPDRLVFSLSPFDSLSYSYYRLFYGDIVENLAEARYLVISGEVTAFGSGSEFSGALDGSLEGYRGNIRMYPDREWRCASRGHRFTLRR